MEAFCFLRSARVQVLQSRNLEVILGETGTDGLLPKSLFIRLEPPRRALRFSKTLFDNSKARLLCKSKTSRLRRAKSSQGRDRRCASLRIAYEKDLDSRLRARLRDPGNDSSMFSAFAKKPLEPLPPPRCEGRAFLSLFNWGQCRSGAAGFFDMAPFPEALTAPGRRNTFGFRDLA